MAKRRLNAKKVAKQPLLKKKMAYFCAKMDFRYGKTPSLLEMLANGHRGYISFSDKDLLREFEKFAKLLQNELDELLEADAKKDHKSWTYREDSNLTNVKFELQECREIEDELFEEIVLK